ncbi:MAG: hypothetical protein N3E47_02700 [Candidatus Bathyarchaeota archaeon]|nr:hypothetical protein [Candidatus Bathyarchaeota archaeon]
MASKKHITAAAILTITALTLIAYANYLVIGTIKIPEYGGTLPGASYDYGVKVELDGDIKLELEQIRTGVYVAYKSPWIVVRQTERTVKKAVIGVAILNIDDLGDLNTLIIRIIEGKNVCVLTLSQPYNTIAVDFSSSDTFKYNVEVMAVGKPKNPALTVQLLVYVEGVSRA